MVLKLLTSEDVLALPTLPVDVWPNDTRTYWGDQNEITHAKEGDDTWEPRLYNDRLFRVRSHRLWETKQ